MGSSPDLLQGLLDDNLSALLDDMLPRDGQFSAGELASTSDTLPFGEFLPMYQASVPGQPFPQEPVFHLGIAGDDNSNDNQGSRKRSGSGAIFSVISVVSVQSFRGNRVSGSCCCTQQLPLF